MKKRCLILGAGKYGEVYAAYLSEAGWHVEGFLDDMIKTGAVVRSLEVLGGIDDLNKFDKKNFDIFCPIGNNEFRGTTLDRARQLGFSTPSFIHSNVQIGPSVDIGASVYILPGSIIMPCSTISDNVMISINVGVAHHTQVGRGVFLSTNTKIGADIDICKNAYSGMSVTAVTGRCQRIGERSFLGAGALLLRDIADDETVVGSPARTLKYAQSQ